MNEPLISIITPTYMRHRFFKQTIRNVQKQIYNLKNVEWIIIDDGEIPVREIVCTHPIQKELRDLVYIYMKPTPKLTIGHKRNIGKTVARGDYIIHLDDDDWYSPTYWAVLVHMLSNSKYQIIGATTMYFIYRDSPYVYRSGPFHRNHCCAGLMGYKKYYAQNTNYDPEATHGEERSFLRQYQQNILQLDNSYHLFLGINHRSNTWDKDKMKKEKTNMLWWEIVKSEVEQRFYFGIYQNHYTPHLKTAYNLNQSIQSLRFLLFILIKKICVIDVLYTYYISQLRKEVTFSNDDHN